MQTKNDRTKTFFSLARTRSLQLVFAIAMVSLPLNVHGNAEATPDPIVVMLGNSTTAQGMPKQVKKQRGFIRETEPKYLSDHDTG